MENNINSRPPMGWNSYDNYDTAVTEAQVKAHADYVVDKLLCHGYEYIVVDIEWYAPNAATRRDEFQYIPFEKNEIDEYGRFIPAPNRFPSAKDGKGFKPLADYVHSKGLKFGIHIMRGIPRYAVHNHMPIKGTDTIANMIAYPSPVCPWNPDMYGINAKAHGAQEYYDSIISLYAEWGVDFIKCDDICNIKGDNPYGAREEVELLHSAIERIKPDIVLSLSPGPALIEEAWHLKKHANMWRITDDFWDKWDLLKDMFKRCEIWQSHVGDGSWPDCDMLPLGYVGENFGNEHMCALTHDEQRTMMTLWCIFRSPLMLGCNLTKIDKWTEELITDETLLGLNKYGSTPRLIDNKNDIVIWENENLKTNKSYRAVFNLNDHEVSYDGKAIAPHASFLIEK